MTVQSCAPAQLFSTVFLHSDSMCALSTDANMVRDVNAFFTWGSLATAPCAIVNPNNAQCYKTDRMGHIVVGHGVIDTRFLGRRLLFDADESTDDSEILSFASWNHTAEPCRMLANAHIQGLSCILTLLSPFPFHHSRLMGRIMHTGEHLSITEEASLQVCVRDRQFGKLVISSLNLSRLVY